jgi:HicB family
MTKSSYPLKLPTSIKDAAARLAKEDGVSLNQWIASAVAQKVGVSETVAHFLSARAGNANPADMMDALNAAPDVAPHAEDALT